MSDFLPEELTQVMTKHGLALDFMKPIHNQVKALVTKVWEIHSQIEAAKSDDSSDVKVASHPFDVKASKDNAAKKRAEELVKAFLAACDVAIDKNRNVAWHLAQIDGDVTAYFTSEVQYYRIKEAPTKPPTSGSKLDALRSDRKVLVVGVRNLFGAMPNIFYVKDADGNREALVEMEEGKVKLPNLQGAGGKSSDSPTGRYAKYRQTIWTIDGNTFPVGTDPRDLVRAIWSGVDRVGKKPTDVFGPIDDARKKAKDKNAVVSVKINGKAVTYQEIESK